jgi:putative membrane protein
LTVASAASAQSVALADAGRLHAADQTFIADGTQAVATQRDAARIATARSTDRDVKAFDERVSSDDAKITDALRAASPRGGGVPRNDSDGAVLASINKLRGAGFDKAYLEQVALAGEQKALSAFQAEIASGRKRAVEGRRETGAADDPAARCDGAGAREAQASVRGRAVSGVRSLRGSGGTSNPCFRR